MSTENAGIEGIQLLDSHDHSDLLQQQTVLLRGRCIGKVSVGPAPTGLWAWARRGSSGSAESYLEAITALIEQDYWHSSTAAPLGQYLSDADMADLKKLKEDLSNWAELEIKADNADRLQGELAQARDLLTEQGGEMVKLKDQVAALQEHASRVYWLGQENGFNQAATFVSRQGLSLNWEQVTETVCQIDGWRKVALDNAEKKKSMPTITKAVEADRMEREAGPAKGKAEPEKTVAIGLTPEETTELERAMDYMGRSLKDWILGSRTTPKPVDGEPSSSASTAAYEPTAEEKMQLEKLTGEIGRRLDPGLEPFDVLKAGLFHARRDLAAVQKEAAMLRDERDFLSWSMMRLSNIVRGCWRALVHEKAAGNECLHSPVAAAWFAELHDKGLRDSRGYDAIDWKKVLDPAHYSGTVSPGMKHWLDSLWTTT